jgi:PPOX class probable F420-dependent enzyme
MPSIPDSHRYLLDSSTAVLATVGPDGRPQLSAVWFIPDGDAVKVSLNTTRQKVKNLRTNPAANLFILDLANPQKYLELRGDATLEDDPDYAFADRLGKKYNADLRQYDPPGASRVVATIVPVKVNAVDLTPG